MIQFKCPQCGKGLSAKEELAGQTGKCPGCSAMIVVPTSVGTASAPEAIAPRPAATSAAGDVGKPPKKWLLLFFVGVPVLALVVVAGVFVYRAQQPALAVEVVEVYEGKVRCQDEEKNVLVVSLILECNDGREVLFDPSEILEGGSSRARDCYFTPNDHTSPAPSTAESAVATEFAVLGDGTQVVRAISYGTVSGAQYLASESSPRVRLDFAKGRRTSLKMAFVEVPADQELTLTFPESHPVSIDRSVQTGQREASR